MPFLSLLVLALLLSLSPAAASAAGGGDMDEEELFGLFEVMGSLLEDPTWAEAHPLPCTDTPWPGVECGLMEETLTFHVTKIHVADDVVAPPCKPSAKLPHSSLLKLPYLTTLSLINCFTHSPFSLSKPLFLSLSSLEHLTLDSNPSLAGEIPSTISNLSSLKTLCLSQNNLTGAIPKEIGSLPNLQQLVLSHNNLNNSIPQEIGGLKKLTILDLSWNSLQETVPTSIGELAALEKIDFSSNKLRGAPPPELGKLKKLVLLDLSNNSFTGPIPENLSLLHQLQYLIMDSNPLNSTIPSTSRYLTNLVALSLSGCGLIGPIPNIFSDMKNLTALSLDNNRLSGGVPAELGELRNLDTLNLSRNHLSGELGFTQEFMNRIGQRLDIRENNGLCSNPDVRTSNTSSRLGLLQNPSCATVILPAARNKTEADKDSDLEPNLYGGGRSSGHRDLDGGLLVLFCGLVFRFFY